jgi:hypothetical protein
MLRGAVLGLIAIYGAPAPARGESLAEVIARAQKARGGYVRLKAVQSVRMTGTMTMGAGPEVKVRIEKKRPRRSRLEFTAQGRTGVQAYDGRKAWGIPPLPGAKPEPLPEEMAGDLESQADLDGPLVDHEAKGLKLRLVGRASVDGKDAWKLELKFKSGDVHHLFLDAETYLEIRAESRRVVQGSAIEVETRLGDYREAGGVLWPHSIEVGPKGRPERQQVRFDTIEVNPAIADARFEMPRQ